MRPPFQSTAAEKTAPPLSIDNLPPMIDRKTVMALLDIRSRHSLRHMVALGRFPEPIRVNQRLHRWRREDVVAWYASRGLQTDGVTAEAIGNRQHSPGGLSALAAFGADGATGPSRLRSAVLDSDL